jgi:hypothetical protein
MSVSMRVAALALAGAFLGCRAHVSVDATEKLGAFTNRLDRTLVLVRSGRLLPAVSEATKPRLVEALRQRGVEAHLAAVAGRLDVVDPPPLAEQARGHGATTVLVLFPNGGALDGHGDVTQVKFRSDLYDVQNDRRVWRADLTCDVTTGEPDGNSADALVAGLLAALQSDALLAPAPAAERRATVSAAR